MVVSTPQYMHIWLKLQPIVGAKKMTPYFARKMPKEKYLARNTAMAFVMET